jgi:uncharacterized protein YndB with AHSA1/START domain
VPEKNPSASAAVKPESEADRELVVTRVFDAPPELVFEAWTNPKHLPHWWGPYGFRTAIHHLDLRPGGDWRLTMRGPDGTDFQNHIVFVEIVKPERLVFRHEPKEGTEPVRFETAVVFASVSRKTEVTLRMVFPSAAERDRVIAKYHADEGGRQTLARLAAYLPEMGSHDLVMERIFNAPRNLVFRAWTDPERLKRWWGPKGFTNPVCEMDARPGGAIRIQMRAPNGDEHRMTGVVQEIVEPERLVFLSAALDKEGRAMFEIRNEVSFADQGSRTRLTLRASVVKSTEFAPQYLAGMEMGWSLSLDRLEADLSLS